MIVMDSSYALALVMRDEARPGSVGQVMQERLLAPFIWPVEIANALRNAVRRKRLVEDEVAAVCADVGEFDVEIVSPWHDTAQRYFDVAQAHRLTPYDATYLELALRRRCALATRDEALTLAARRLGVPVHG